MKDKLGEPFPKVLIYILTESGYDSKAALTHFKCEDITYIEEFFNKNYERLCSGLLGSKYENIQPFKILPGHCVFLQNIPTYLKQDLKRDRPISNAVQNSSIFTCILKSLIETAESNSDRNPTGKRYDEIIRYFSTYLFLMSGKSCYETLSANLPIPQANTIRKT